MKNESDLCVIVFQCVLNHLKLNAHFCEIIFFKHEIPPSHMTL